MDSGAMIDLHTCRYPVMVIAMVFLASSPAFSTDGEDGNGFLLFAEGGLAVGGISHDFNDDAIQQFGYPVKSGCEQDGASLRGGIGRYFSSFGTFIYGELGYIGPGALFDNHGPWILPEVLLSMTEIAGGIEFRYHPARVRFGYGTYLGTATVDQDTVGSGSPGSWSTDIQDGRGFHYAVGAQGPANEWLDVGVEWFQHFITLKLAESNTGAEPAEHSATQSGIRIYAAARLPI